MAFTISRYLKLKIADDLSSDAKYNLEKIDALGAIFSRDTESDTNVRSSQNIFILPEDPSIGGSGNGSGAISLGINSNPVSVTAYSSSFRIRSPLQIKNSNETYLSLTTPASSTTTASLTLDVNNTNKTAQFLHSGEVVIADAAQTLTNKIISANANTISNLRNDNLASDAGIADTKLATITSAGKIANSATTATPSNFINTIVSRDGGGNFTANTITAAVEFLGNLVGDVTGTVTGQLIGNVTGNVSGNVSGTASNITGIAAISNGGTGASTVEQARSNLLPTYVPLSTLRVNSAGTGIEWVTGAGLGTVTSVDLSMPDEFQVSNNPVTITGTLTVNKKSQSPNQVYASPTGTSGVPTFRSLLEADIPTLNQSKVTNLVSDLASKEPTIAAGTASQYWRGDKTWQTLNTAAVTESTALYFTDTRARTAAVVNSTAGSETDIAPSVSAIKAFVNSKVISTTWSTGATTTITHNLNSPGGVFVSIFDENNQQIMIDEIVRVDSNTVTLTSSVSPTGTWTVLIRN